MKNYILKIIAVSLLIPYSISCESALDEEVFSELTTETFLNTEEGLRTVLNSSYSNVQYISGGFAWFYTLSAMPSGESYNRGGTVEAFFTPLSNFTWDSNLELLNFAWNKPYEAIRDANILLDNIDNEALNGEYRKLLSAEARFIRGYAYTTLYDYFGATPIFDSSEPTNLTRPRSTDEEMRNFIETDFLSAAENLPISQEEYGRATKGSALGLLCKFYLNTAQWQKSADTAMEIMNMQTYSLVPDYKDVFSLANEGNSEMLWVHARTAIGGRHELNQFIFPTDYPFLPNKGTYAARIYLFDDFVNSFEEDDQRLNLIVTNYINRNGEEIQLLGNDQSLPAKYEFDSDATGNGDGNDFPVVRYADILLARAEALNELNGPSTEAIDLINQVRARSGVSLIGLNEFNDANALRSRIQQEREWEFYAEVKRREDQKRFGNFISLAQQRGKNAKDFQVLFPIPEREIDANPNLNQNSGY